MSQNIILTQALNYLINKRASLELKSHWNNISMASSIHMAHSLFCFVFIKNEDVALSSDISNELRHNNYFCLYKTIMVTQLQDIFCKIASSGENMSSSTFIGRNEECCKVFANTKQPFASWKKVRFFMHYCISSCRLSRLSLVVCLQSTVCLSVCLCACLWRGQLLQMFDIRYSEWPLVQVFQKVINIFNDLDLLHAFYFSQWFILFQFTFFWKYINILLQGKSSTHKKESCYSGN